MSQGGIYDVRSGNGAFQSLGRTVVYDSNSSSRGLEFVQAAGVLILCVSPDTGQYLGRKTYSTGQDSHIADLGNFLELQKLMNNMATNIS